MREPTARPGVYDIYWRFAAERQRVFESRVAGLPGPWTNDPILSEYKFCNVYRAADRVSQYLISQVIYAPDNCDAADKLFQIVAFRTFSNILTWDTITRILGHSPRLPDLASGSFESALNEAKRLNGKLYAGAFILCASDIYGRRAKHLNHVELFKDMFIKSNLADKIIVATSLKEVYQLLHHFPMMGNFMSYQVAIDLNYSNLINFSENDFTVPGPGALRGINKMFISLGDLTPSEIVMWTVKRQAEEFARLGLRFNGLFGRPIQAIDAQNLFCEVDKYCRKAIPSLTSDRVKIKSRFIATPKPIKLFFPPKWGISQQILGEAVLK